LHGGNVQHTYKENDSEDVQQSLTIEEMRAQLGIFGKLLANSVEVGIITAGSYLSGGCFGYVMGGITGVPSLFRSNGDGMSLPPPNKNMQPLVPTPPPQRGMGEKIKRRLVSINSKAVTQAKSWAHLSASLSAFHALTRVCRGSKEDKWNSIIGSACTGAYLSRQGVYVFC